MNDKYFVPDIEDLRVGYEMEFNNAVILPNSTADWKKVILKGVDSAVAEYLRLNWYRTPYLTKEQIEAEGWIPTQSSPNAHHKGHGCRFVHVWNDKPTSNSYIYYMGEGIFMGEIKSINEFRFICKLLKIDKQ